MSDQSESILQDAQDIISEEWAEQVEHAVDASVAEIPEENVNNEES